MTDGSCSQEESAQICEVTSHHPVPVGVVKATCQSHLVERDRPSLSRCMLELPAVRPGTIPAAFEEADSCMGLSTVPKQRDDELARLQ